MGRRAGALWPALGVHVAYVSDTTKGHSHGPLPRGEPKLGSASRASRVLHSRVDDGICQPAMYIALGSEDSYAEAPWFSKRNHFWTRGCGSLEALVARPQGKGACYVRATGMVFSPDGVFLRRTGSSRRVFFVVYNSCLPAPGYLPFHASYRNSSPKVLWVRCSFTHQS